MDNNGLWMRRQLCLMAIQTVSTVRTPDEATAEEKESALAEYNRQLKVIDNMIFEATGQRPDIVINLEAASLVAKSSNVGG